MANVKMRQKMTGFSIKCDDFSLTSQAKTSESTALNDKSSSICVDFFHEFQSNGVHQRKHLRNENHLYAIGRWAFV